MEDKTTSAASEAFQKPLSVKERVRAQYGVNQPITDEYDKSLSVRCRNGTFVGRRREDILSFRGIPFAKPPVGSLRWKRPEPVGFSDGVFEAYYNGKTPIQTEWETEVASYYPQGEDCLYLNIWMNRSCEQTAKTVMVFFHGGSYGWGGTADPLYDGHNFVTANPDIILVTVGYRTGLMGFVDLSYLEGGDKYSDAPNLGLLDQIESLRWIRDNIHAFGGNPDNVTVFGESAGGGSVSLLPIIPQAKGLFKRVIAQSGSVALTFSKEECRDFTRRLLAESGKRTLKELLSMSEEELMRVNEKLNMYNNFPQRDGKLIPLNPYDAYRKGMTADIDILIGTNANETNYWVGEIGGIVPFRFSIPVKYENDLRVLNHEDKARLKKFMSMQKGHEIWGMAEFYDEVMFRLPAIRQAELHTVNGGKAYMYYWIQPSTLPFRGACHAVELSYVFGNTQETIFTGEPAHEGLSNLVMKMWANFARTGNPSTDGFEWPEYDVAARNTAVLSTQPIIAQDVLSKQRKLLMPIIRHMISASYATLDYNVPFVRKAIGITATIATLAAGFAVTKWLRNRLK